MMRPLRTQASRRALQSCCCSSRPVLSRHATQFLPAQSRSFHPPEYSPADQKDFNRKVRELVKSSPVPENARIAIVGAGLTGLTTAYYLAQDLPPGCKIVIYDGQNRVGGWIRSETHSVDVGGTKSQVLFERGPRAISPGDTLHGQQDRLVLYDLLLNHGLIAYPGRPNLARFIYSPQGHLVNLSGIRLDPSIFEEPIYRLMLKGGLWWTLKWRFRRPGWFPKDDVSLGEYVERASGSRQLVEDVASAGVHGIWGGDIDKISAMSALGLHFQSANLTYGQAEDLGLRVTEQRFVSQFLQDRPYVKTMYALKPPALVNFGKFGLESLPIALANSLESDSKVEMRLGNPISGIEYDPSERKVKIQDSNQQTEVYDKVISTTSGQHAYQLTGGKLKHLQDSESVNIMTVNLWYPQETLVPPGSATSSPKLNPERALGVFFDSNVAEQQQRQEGGTKVFVLMGGHQYDGMEPPSEAQAIDQAKTLLHRHLGIPVDLPSYAVSKLAKGCLPQHHVGHHRRMASLSYELMDKFENRLALIGGSYSRPGVASALRAGFDMAHAITRENFYDNGVTRFSHKEVSDPYFPFGEKAYLDRNQ
ncbi:unnamed protein product [Clonostachys rosea f. rosea IK726]|uniref:Uncharacterized protein n=1 Tax=Clonostachys rosea f. rosea IK726 TaxID=1349383 RepID=A0ACA9TEG9_BIOOC|nr:unnamed protein product [Clonostachys rosea f. rosea IK726]